MAEKTDPVDVSQLAKRNLSETAFPGGGKQEFRVFFAPAIHGRIAAHAAEKLSLEICGVLVGHWHRDADGPFVLVDESIRCDKAVSNAGDVTFTHEAWNTEIYPQMDKKFTDREIVGWYHSHPNYGIFLSDRDGFIQEHYFNGPGHIAYVVDPVNGLEGVFAWHNGKTKLCPHFWVGSEVHLSTEGAGRKPSSTSSPAGQPAAATPKPEVLPPLSASVTWILVALCFLLLGYLAGSKLTTWDRNMLVRGVVAHYGLFKGLKPGLRESMDKVDDNLRKITQVVDTLAKENINSLPADAQDEKKKQWIEVVQALQITDMAVRELNNIYSLTPEEAAEVQQLINAKQAENENLQTPPAKDSAVHDSGQKTTAAKTTGEKAATGKAAAEPSKSAAAPLPAKAPDVKRVEGTPAETNRKP